MIFIGPKTFLWSGIGGVAAPQLEKIHMSLSFKSVAQLSPSMDEELFFFIDSALWHDQICEPPIHPLQSRARSKVVGQNGCPERTFQYPNVREFSIRAQNPYHGKTYQK